jgi:hypothetical protein
MDPEIAALLHRLNASGEFLSAAEESVTRYDPDRDRAVLETLRMKIPTGRTATVTSRSLTNVLINWQHCCGDFFLMSHEAGMPFTPAM